MGSRAVESCTKRDAARERSQWRGGRTRHALFNIESAQFCSLFSDAMLHRSRISQITEARSHESITAFLSSTLSRIVFLSYIQYI